MRGGDLVHAAVVGCGAAGRIIGLRPAASCQSLELGANGKAAKWYGLHPFDLHITPESVAPAVAAAVRDGTAGLDRPATDQGVTL